MHVQQSPHSQGAEGKQHDTLPFRELQGGMWLLVLICTQLFQLNRGRKNAKAVNLALRNMKPFKETLTPFCGALEQTTAIYYQQNPLLVNEKESFLSFQALKKKSLGQISQGPGHSPTPALLNYLHSGSAALTYVYVSSFIMMNSCPRAMERLTGGEAEDA